MGVLSTPTADPLWPPPASSGVPLAAEMEAFLMNYQSPSPDAVLDATISGCTDHDKLPQRADQLLSVSVSSSESY